MQVIEIGKGSKVKYELDKKTGLIKVINCAKLIFLCFPFIGNSLLNSYTCRLTGCFTPQLYTPITMASSLVLSARTMIPWMSWLSCRHGVWLSCIFFFWACICECLHACLEALWCHLMLWFCGIFWTYIYVQEPVLPGCFLRAKAIGLMPMIDQVCIAQLKFVLFLSH